VSGKGAEGVNAQRPDEGRRGDRRNYTLEELCALPFI